MDEKMTKRAKNYRNNIWKRKKKMIFFFRILTNYELQNIGTGPEWNVKKLEGEGPTMRTFDINVCNIQA